MTQLQDRFEGANGTHLANHTPNIGGPWTDLTPNWQLLGNAAHSVGNTADSTAPINTRVPWAQMTINPNGQHADQAVTLSLAENDDYNNYVDIQLRGNDTIRVDVGNPASLGGQATYKGPVLTGDHVLGIQVGPQQIKATLDGAVVAVYPRTIAGNIVFTLAELQFGSEGPCPLVKDLIIN